MAGTSTAVAARRLRRGSLVAGMGDGIVASALPLLAVGLTRDPLDVASVVAAQHLAWVAVAVLGLGPGDRRTAVGSADSLRAVAVGLLGLVALGGMETLVLLQVTAFAVGLGEAVGDETDLPAGARWRGIEGVALLGLPLGGFLYEALPAVPLLVDALLFTVASLYVLAVPERLDSPPGEPLGIPAGWPRLVAGTGLATAVTAAASAASSAVLGILVLFAVDDLGIGAPAFGLLLAGLAAAALVGALVGPELGQRLGLRPTAVVAFVAAGAGHVAAALVADPSRPIVAALALGVGTGGAMVATVVVRVLVHAAAHRPLDPAAMRAFHLWVWAAIPTGALVGGWVAGRTAVDDVVLGAGAVLVATGAVAGFIGRGFTGDGPDPT